MPGRSERLAEVARAFHRLGWTSFGGPTAHFAYFRHEFVTRRGWLDEATYAELLALVQLLPGPASSQLGVTIGIRRAGLAGGALAWLAFTLPSAALMFAFATVVDVWGEVSTNEWLRGLRVVVVGVVAQAVLSMARRLCPDWPRRAIAVIGVGVALLVSGPPGQLLTIMLGAVAGRLVLDDRLRAGAAGPGQELIGGSTATGCLAAFVILLAGLPVLSAVARSDLIALIDSFYRAGALVFGGGHVVLPLLQAEIVTPGRLSSDLFVTGYGAAQAVPGPLFSFAAYLGALIDAPAPAAVTSILCLIAVFLPSMLLLVGVLPVWARLRELAGMGATLSGIGAAVVGLLGAALIDPIIPSAIRTPLDVLLAAAVFGLLLWGRLPVWLVVIVCAIAGALVPV